MGSFREKFGLEWLPGPGEGTPDANKPSTYLDDAVLAYTPRLLQELQGKPEGGRLFDLAGKLGARVDTLSGVCRQLVQKGYVNIEEERRGNDLLKLTPQGETFLRTFLGSTEAGS